MIFIDFLFGIGIFLYGMSELEKGIHSLGDARLKMLLRSGSSSRLSSVLIGAITTAILQSSSVVSLLVMAFASAGMLPLVNAIGIILGANLGTTATGWIVATLGFKLDLEALAIPLVGASAFVLVLLREGARLHSSARVFIGIGLLLLGLGIMKTSMETLPQQWDVASFSGRSAFVYLLAGIFVTLLVQSSSAVVMMALTALNSGLIGLPDAAALVIGADLGTTGTAILASIPGNTIKRKLAAAHFSFNLIVNTVAFFLLLPLLPQLLSILQIQDPLYGLVAFQSTFNFLGLLVFVPFLYAFTNCIERLFASSGLQSQDILESVPANITDAALIALQKKSIGMEVQAISNGMHLFDLHRENNTQLLTIASKLGMDIDFKDFQQGYEILKAEESNVAQYVLDIQLQPLQEIQVKALEASSRIVRQLIYANKTLKDIAHDLDEISASREHYLREYYARHQQFFGSVCDKLIALIGSTHPQSLLLEEFQELELHNNEHYIQLNRFVHDSITRPRAESLVLSMLLNVNHEMHHATKQLVESVRELSATMDRNAIVQHSIPVHTASSQPHNVGKP